MSDEKDGVYCRVCGGIVPGSIDIKQILVDGKATGINQLEYIIEEVKNLGLAGDADIKVELLKRAKVLNYIPTKKEDAYAEGLLEAFKQG
ncbi:NAC family transcription factor [Methanospirillum sp.]|uniref:NAC family transcription factor n=2 Tax=Methanospirillum sp. TaxID=45200 RepID=UPI002BA80ED6|nr:NAC family transcription factor [Methanospirillum sp.]HOL41693.1 NAC family transcription factor [Methanospirillum sp.]HPP77819.1 NAC family transcription factor [Methanospirillum sp.]